MKKDGSCKIDLSNVNWVKRFPVDSLQIYFPASLEIQKELIDAGFKVPSDKSGKIKTPIPIIYSNFRGWLREPDPITVERLISPKEYGKDPTELGWVKTFRGRKEAFKLPQEKVYVDIGFDDKKLMYFKLIVDDYHLEKTSIRGVNPEKWTNWAMFYLDASYLDALIDIIERNLNLLSQHFTLDSFIFKNPIKLKSCKEIKQGGKEKTIFVSVENCRGSLGIPIHYYSLCLGCFSSSISYFKYKTIDNMLNEEVVNKLRLRIVYDRNIPSGLKVGIAKIDGKRLQIMFKLASRKEISIRGILKDRIKGKARGKLCYCDHKSKLQLFVVRTEVIYLAFKFIKENLLNSLK